MYYGFETENENAALGALIVYGIYRSRDMKRLKITPDIWNQIERAVKSSAKRAIDLHDFIEKLKPRLMCSGLKPRWMNTEASTITMFVDKTTGEVYQKSDKGRRQFWVEIFESVDHQPILEVLYQKTSWIIALVRDRLERERPLETSGIIKENDEEEEINA
jgi:hypothetical protein